jgi:hypothetical protein
VRKGAPTSTEHPIERLLSRQLGRGVDQGDKRFEAGDVKDAGQVRGQTDDAVETLGSPSVPCDIGLARLRAPRSRWVDATT